MHRRFFVPGFLAANLAGSLIFPAAHAAAAEPPGDAAYAARLAQASGGLGYLSGGAHWSTEAQIAAELANVVADDERLRILVTDGQCGMQAAADLLLVRGMDLAIIQADALAELRRQRAMPAESTIQYLAKLHQMELHILARHPFTRLQELDGQAIGAGPRASGSALTAGLVLRAAGISPRIIETDMDIGLERLRRRDIVALACVTGTPAPLFRGLDAPGDFRLLPIPLTSALVESWLPSRLTAAHYPDLLRDVGSVETVAVGAVLATLAASPSSERYRRMSRLTDLLFSRFEQLKAPGHHPKWQEVNLSASLPGWTRFAPAQAQLDRQAAALEAGLRAEFDAYLRTTNEPTNAAERDALFKEFLRWRGRQSPEGR